MRAVRAAWHLNEHEETVPEVQLATRHTHENCSEGGELQGPVAAMVFRVNFCIKDFR